MKYHRIAQKNCNNFGGHKRQGKHGVSAQRKAEQRRAKKAANRAITIMLYRDTRYSCEG